VVAALGFGVLASGPSSAAIDETLSLSASTGTVAVGETLTVTVTNTFVSESAMESSTIFVSNPSAFGSIASFMTTDSANANAITARGSTTSTDATLGDTVVATSAGAFTKGVFTIQMRNAQTAGTYNVVVTSRNGSGTIKKSALLTVTVTAAVGSTPDATNSTAFIVQGTGAALASASAIADSTVVLSKGTAASPASGAVILITQKNSLGTTTYGNSAAVGESITAYIASGPGTLLVATRASNTAARVVSAKVGETITVLNDGTSGVASIVLGSTSLGSTWKTKSVTFYGDAAKATVALKGTGVVSDDSSNRTNELRVTLRDSSDVLFTNAANLYLNSDNETIVATGWVNGVTVDATLGYASVDLSSFIDLNDSGTAKISLSSYGPDSTTAQKAVGFISNELTMNVVGKAASFKMSLDKKEYKPGDIAKVTISVFDGLGKAVADTAIASMLTSVGVTANGNTTSSGDTITTASATHGQGKYVYEYTIPQTSGNLVFKAIGSTGLPTAGQVTAWETVTVTDPAESAANSALDAAQEATDAAIAATDAAVLAQESADAAAVAAEAAAETAAEAADAAKAAVDAVTKLSAEVTKLLTQLAALQRLMNRIAKKVGVKV